MQLGLQVGRGLALTSLLSQGLWMSPTMAQGQTATPIAVEARQTPIANASIAKPPIARTAPPKAQPFLPYCQQTTQEIEQKDALRAQAMKGDRDSQRRYDEVTQQHAEHLRQCRQQNWLRNQGIWLRLYPCDTRSGAIEAVLDRIVDRGYNQVYVETFFNGQVLLPKASNRTAWQSMIQTPGQDQVDLLAEVIRKGRQRGLKVYAWMFSLNVGYPYVTKLEKRGTIAVNGRGQTTIETNLATKELNNTFNPDEAFADPYHPTLRQDYLAMVQEVAKRKPDGMLFDYIRYPKGRGKDSVANDVRDLWIYGEASRTAILQRALNNKGRDLIDRYLQQGGITASDLQEVDRRYPQETDPPLWHGRSANPQENTLPLSQRQTLLQNELWRLSVGHAMQGVVDYLVLASNAAQQAGIPTGAVFFPDANQTVSRGYDSRLQPWDRFPENIERHAMSYATCGESNCITAQVQRTLDMSINRSIVKPVLAGIWQQSISNRPPLEVQMQEIRRIFPQADTVSHFAFSWQEPESDRDRKFCRSRQF
ncbi:family 10 glycosylhydrolase [Alkalinema sp. FACHB-956]|uniref:family 10 glycosylhydrolase n=1 Tax=Alkalinema sp. FACHB-956 TaxID=2692768 RepID=UPI001686377B|nr:family 10 glycosylhydrolase [Alkalinema sp. FACHB-956]MBD2329736.1 family 10 glycosylhydrolase [Alkalinema sp. FACHB-956]